MNKKITIVLALVIGLVFFYACSETEIQEEYELEYKSEIVNLTELININKKNNKTQKQKKTTNVFIQSVFQTDFVIPQNLSSEKLKEYIKENKNLINGRLEFLINGTSDRSFDIINGKILRTKKKAKKQDISLKQLAKSMNVDPEYPLMDECSYDGIQDCIQYAVYEEWTYVETAICIATGTLDCIAVEATACIETNCF